MNTEEKVSWFTNVTPPLKINMVRAAEGLVLEGDNGCFF